MTHPQNQTQSDYEQKRTQFRSCDQVDMKTGGCQCPDSNRRAENRHKTGGCKGQPSRCEWAVNFEASHELSRIDHQHTECHQHRSKPQAEGNNEKEAESNSM